MDVRPPIEASSYDDIAAALQQVRLQAGASYRELHRRVLRVRARRGVPEVPAYDTVYRCLQPGRTRLDVDLVLDVVRALGADRDAVAGWRAACAAAGRAHLPRLTENGTATVTTIDPARVQPLVGRGAEIAAIAVRPDRYLITGLAGVGKTAVALAAAACLVETGHADKAVLVGLEGFSDHPPPSPAAVAEALRIRLGAASADAARLVHELARQRVVLVLDNVGTEQDLSWLAETEQPASWILLTSRRRLRWAADAHCELGPLATGEGVEILVSDPVRRADPAAARLVALAGGLPLALTLTRARIRARPDWSLADHAAQITELQRLRQLDPGVQASLTLSYATLSGEEAATLRLLGSWPVRTVTAPLVGAGIDVGHPERTLADLHRQSLVEAQRERYGLHDLVRVFAAARSLADDAPSVRLRALTRLLDAQAAMAGAAMAHYAPLERDRQPTLPRPPPGFVLADAEAARTWLEDERANLLQATAYAVHRPDEHDRLQHAVRLSILLFRFLDLNGWLEDAERLHGWAVAAAVDPDDRARTLNMWGITAWSAGRLDDGYGRLMAALAAYQELNDLAGEARVSTNLGGLRRDHGDAHAALRFGHRSLELTTQLADRVGQAIAHTNLGVAHESLDDHARALGHHRAAYDLAVELVDSFGRARSLANVADILMVTGAHQEARPLLEECRELAESTHYDRIHADVLNHLATLDSLAGHHAAAIAGHQRAIAVAESRGMEADVIRQHLAETRERASAADAST